MMTNEQAAIKLQNILNDDTYSWHPAHAETLEMAVEALKANLVNESGGLVKDSQGNWISRQAAIDAHERIFDRCEEIEAHLPENDPDRVGYKMYPDWLTVWKYLKQLPPAQPEQRWIPWNSGKFPEESGTYTVTAYDGVTKRVTYAKYQNRLKRWELTGARAYWRVLAWMPLPEPYKEGGEEG